MDWKFKCKAPDWTTTNQIGMKVIALHGNVEISMGKVVMSTGDGFKGDIQS
jgi:hypothetical protein